jgi:hypothetical protein
LIFQAVTLQVRDEGYMTVFPARMIDFHVHLFPDDFFDAIWGFFKREYGMDVVHQMYARECIDYLRARDVGSIVYSNYAHRKGTAGTLNDWNVKLLDSTEDVYCFAAFHPDDDDALERARDLLQHPKVLGFKLHFLVQPIRPDDERLHPLYELVADTGRRLLLHIGTGPIGNDRVGMAFLRTILAHYPDLRANVAHLGAHEFDQAFTLLEEYPGVFLDTSFCFLPGSFRLYRLGPELLEKHRHRLLYGSDFPNLLHHRREELSALAGMNLSREFYHRVFRENAEALLRLHQSSL